MTEPEEFGREEPRMLEERVKEFLSRLLTDAGLPQDPHELIGRKFAFFFGEGAGFPEEFRIVLGIIVGAEFSATGSPPPRVPTVTLNIAHVSEMNWDLLEYDPDRGWSILFCKMSSEPGILMLL